MTQTKRLNVVVVGRSPEKMDRVAAVLESHGFAATGVSSEQEALGAMNHVIPKLIDARNRAHQRTGKRARSSTPDTDRADR